VSEETDEEVTTFSETDLQVKVFGAADVITASSIKNSFSSHLTIPSQIDDILVCVQDIQSETEY